VLSAQRNVKHVEILAEPVDQLSEDFDLFDENDRKLKKEDGLRLGVKCLKFAPDRKSQDGDIVQKFVDQDSKFHVVEKISGRRVSVKRLHITVTYTIETKFAPFKFHEYFDIANGKSLFSAATANISVGDITGDVVLLHKSMEGTAITFVPSKSKK